jgi:hypothetical protein
MLPAAYVVHRTRHRVRLRVVGQRRNPGWFAEAASVLGQLDWIDRVETNVHSCSLTLHCIDADCMDENLAQSGVFKFQAQAPQVASAVDQIQIGLSRIDRTLQSKSSANTNLRSLLFLLILVLAGVQMVRGQVMVPAISLLWYAIDLVMNARGQNQPNAGLDPQSSGLSD